MELERATMLEGLANKRAALEAAEAKLRESLRTSEATANDLRAAAKAMEDEHPALKA